MTGDSLARRVWIELGVVGLGTVVFVTAVPYRTTAVHAVLAALAGLALLANARFTRERVWARFPARRKASERTRAAWVASAAFTLAGLAVLAVIDVVHGTTSGGVDEARRRLFDGRLWIAIPVYFPWALLQQSLFQFYFLGRVLTLVRPATAIVTTGLAYGLVHLPNVGVAVATSAAGVVWTALYFRDRRIAPIAASHAILGAALYDWVIDRDLLAWWASSWSLG